MSTTQLAAIGSPVLPSVESCQQPPVWYAIHTRAKHERSVVCQLGQWGIPTFLPVINELHHWSDRRRMVEVPLFSCYAFVQIPPAAEYKAKVVFTRGVLRIVGSGSAGTPIPDSQIESIRILLASTVQHTVCPFLKVGERIRVRGGALEGVEGILVARNGTRNLVISLEPIQKSISVSIDGYGFEAA